MTAESICVAGCGDNCVECGGLGCTRCLEGYYLNQMF